MSKKDYPPALILRYRALENAGEFDRKIVSSRPVSIDKDEVKFECGHKLNTTLLPIAEADDGKLYCRQCGQAWIDRALKDEGKPQ